MDLKKWTNNLIEDTERNLSKEVFKSILLNNRSMDIFSSWILLISGATFTLVIPNLESIKNLIGLINIQTFLYLMLISSIFGILAKYCFIIADIFFNVTIALESRFPQIINKFESEKTKIINIANQNSLSIKNIEIDAKRVMQPIIDQFPKIYHRFMWKVFNEGKKDLLLNYKKAAKFSLKGNFYMTMQIIFLVVAILIFAINIKIL